MNSQLLFLCDQLQPEVESLELPPLDPPVEVRFFPCRCAANTRTEHDITSVLVGSENYAAVHVCSGSCVEIPDQEKINNLRWHRVDHSLHLVTNPELVDFWARQGQFLVTPGWLQRWRQVIEEQWGFTRSRAREFFAEWAAGVTLLDTGVDAESSMHLEDFSGYVGLPHRVVPVGLEYLKLLLTNMLLAEEFSHEEQEIGAALGQMRRELADYAMAMELLKELTQVQQEGAVKKKIIEIFSALFAPDEVRFLPEPEAADDRIAGNEGDGMVLPMASGGHIQGTLVLSRLRFPQYREQYQKLAEGMVGLCGLALENAKRYQAMKELSGRDGLTGLANRRRLDEHLNQEWKRMAREQRPLSLVMCDIDYFKAYNDYYGHLAGDECLREVATLLAACARRPADLAARYGGEEFILVYPDTGALEALELAESIRKGTENLNIPHLNSPAGSHVTLSLGVASTVPGPGSQPQDLVASSDKALYEAKNSGRNQAKLGAAAE